MEEREVWRRQIESLKRMRQWVLDAEHILDGSWDEQDDKIDNKAQDKDSESTVDRISKNKKSKDRSRKEQNKKNKYITNDKVTVRFDTWRGNLAKNLEDGTLTEKEHECLNHFLRVLDNLRPYLIQCYDREDFPRTNNETEGCIHKIKTRYRRISGRKNWNRYLLKHGRNVGFYDWWESTSERWLQFEKLAQNVKKECWIQNRKESKKAQSEQLTRYRFCHQREKYLAILENRWESTASLASDDKSLILH